MRTWRMLLLLLVALASARPAAAGAGEGVVLLNGFEPEVLKEWAARREAHVSSYLKVVRIGEDGVPVGGGMNGAIVAGDATEGRHAMVRSIPREGGRGSDYSLNFLKDENTVESIRRVQGGLLNTFGTFRDFYPHDWSAYAGLRLDVKSEGSPLRLRVEIEDVLVVPPLRRVYDVPADKWVTVEFDLADAARGREVAPPDAQAGRPAGPKIRGRLLNLKEMANLRVGIEHISGKCVVKLDNLRLVTAAAAEAETSLPILRDDRPFPVPAALPPSQPRPREQVGGRLNREPLKWEPPVDIPLSAGQSYGLQPFDVAPLDNDRMLMAVSTGSVLRTTDGGRTWTGLDGTPDKPTRVIDHDTNAPGRTAAAIGPDILVAGVAKCSGGATPVDSYAVLTRFGEGDWKVQPRGLLDVDDRHCPEHRVRLVGLPGGRIWACWLHYTRFGGNELCARYSDDWGATWRDPASNGLVQLATRGRTNPYAITWWTEEPAPAEWATAHSGGRIGPMDPHPPLETAPWADQVVCAYVRNNKLTCCFFDGTRWGEPEPAGVAGAPLAMAHLEGGTVYLATSAGKVFRLEGRKWLEDGPDGIPADARLPYPGGSPVRLSAAGRAIVAIWTDGHKLSVSRKPAGGAWSRPREIFDEQQGVHWIGAPARSVDNFVPLVWSVVKGGARFVRIPVDAPGRSEP